MGAPALLTGFDVRVAVVKSGIRVDIVRMRSITQVGSLVILPHDGSICQACRAHTTGQPEGTVCSPSLQCDAGACSVHAAAQLTAHLRVLADDCVLPSGTRCLVAMQSE